MAGNIQEAQETQDMQETPVSAPERSLPWPLMMLAMATPGVVALLVHLNIIWNAMVANPGDVALGGGIFLIFTSPLVGMAALMITSAQYDLDGRNREPHMVMIAGFLSIVATAGVTAGATLVAVHEPQHPLTGTAIGLMTGGVLAMFHSIILVHAEAALHPEMKQIRLVLTAQLMAIASAAVVTTGVLIICRSQLGL